MIHGLDTGFLVAAEVFEHSQHTPARAILGQLLSRGDRVAIAPQILAEFIHIVTDPRRFASPLDMGSAISVADQWWTASEVERVYPNPDSTRQFLDWLKQYSLGRKRLLDTMLAATYRQAGISSILTTNPSDFGVFGAFNCVTPLSNLAVP